MTLPSPREDPPEAVRSDPEKLKKWNAYWKSIEDQWFAEDEEERRSRKDDPRNRRRRRYD